jgi:molecular chaperone GrpE
MPRHGAGEAASGEGLAPEHAPSSEVDRLRAELQEASERVLRSQAELENFRRRTRRETQEELRFANQPLVMDLLAVMDNVQRAIDAAQQTHDSAGLLEGFRMVALQLSETLKKYGCAPIDAVGQAFDPTHHQAIAQQPSDQVPAGSVIEVPLAGYQLHDRVIRPAQVVVSTGGAEAHGNEDVRHKEPR